MIFFENHAVTIGTWTFNGRGGGGHAAVDYIKLNDSISSVDVKITYFLHC